MSCRSWRRGGFTLVELVAAVAIGGLVLLCAGSLLWGVAGLAGRSGVAAAADRDANAERLLRRLLAGADVSGVGAASFAGDSAAARFATWCAVAGGWQEKCGCALRVERSGEAIVLVAVLESGQRVILRDGLRAARLLYLSDAAKGGVWLRAWGDSPTAPAALLVLLDHDSLVVRVGARG